MSNEFEISVKLKKHVYWIYIIQFSVYKMELCVC